MLFVEHCDLIVVVRVRTAAKLVGKTTLKKKCQRDQATGGTNNLQPKNREREEVKVAGVSLGSTVLSHS